MSSTRLESQPLNSVRTELQRRGDGRKVALGFVEGLNNKVRVTQRRAYGSATSSTCLKILTCMLGTL